MPKKTPASVATPARAPARREPLTASRICDAALVLIERDGLQAFSTRKLGLELGCEAMSLYHHFPSKAHVLDALVDRLLAELPDPAASLSPAARLRVIAQAWRELAQRYPQFQAWLALHRWNSPVGVSVLARLLRCFSDAGMDAERSARSLRAFGYYLIGASLEETQGYGRGASALSSVSEEDLRAQHPELAEAGRFFAPSEFDATFELGLSALLSALGLEPTRR